MSVTCNFVHDGSELRRVYFLIFIYLFFRSVVIDQDLSAVRHFDDAVKHGVNDEINGMRQQLSEARLESDISGLDKRYVLTAVFVRREVKGVKRITSQKIIPVDRESLIFKMSPGSGHQLIKFLYSCVCGKVWLERLGWKLLSVYVDGQKLQIVMFEREQVFIEGSGEHVIIHHNQDDRFW